MPWYRADSGRHAHRKMKRLAQLLGVHRMHAIGIHDTLCGLVTEAGRLDGSLDGISALDLALETDWSGDPEALMRALVVAGLVDRPDGDDRLVVHDFAERAGSLKENARKADYRATKGGPVAIPGQSMYGRTDGRTNKRTNGRTDGEPTRQAGDDPPRECVALAETVCDAWDRIAVGVFAPAARPLSSRFLKDLESRINADTQRLRLDWWTATIRHAVERAQFLRRKRPPTTLAWLIAKESNLARLAAGDFDRVSDDAETPTRAPTKRPPYHRRLEPI